MATTRVDEDLSKSCDLVVGVSEEICTDVLLTLMETIAKQSLSTIPNAAAAADFSLQLRAVLTREAPRVGASSTTAAQESVDPSPSMYVVIHVQGSEIVSVAIKRGIEGFVSLRSAGKVDHPLLSIAWVDRSVVDGHCSVAHAAVPAHHLVYENTTLLEYQLSAKRSQPSRKRAHVDESTIASTGAGVEGGDDSGALDCVVWYVPNHLSTSTSNDSVAAALAATGECDELLRKMHSVVLAVGGGAVASHFVSETGSGKSKRMFFRLTSQEHALNMRDIILQGAKGGTLDTQLAQHITTATLKPCTFKDMKMAMDGARQ